MMKRIPIKLQITIWLTLLTALLSVLMLLFMLSVSAGVVFKASVQQLTQTVRDNLPLVGLTEGHLEVQEGFHFSRNGVSLLLYSRNQTLLAGQIPASFTASLPFENGEIRTVPIEEAQYLVLDMWIPENWEEGVWLRGLMEIPQNHQVVHNLLEVSLIALPAFILLSAVGAWLILKKAFRPLDNITATAEAISTAGDLSRRIGLPTGRDEVSRLGATFDRLFERLERSFEAEKQFTSDASHELRTPVSIIKGACEYGMKYDETPEERQETLSMIYRQTQKMSRLIAQLLNMTRLEQGTEVVHLETLDLGRLVQEICEEQGYSRERVICTLQDEIFVQADAALLGRLLQNLVENALKYGKPEEPVRITVYREGQEALVSVRDEGMGIEQKQQEKIWQRFYQADPSRSDEGGAGLGLAIVQQIARLHGGYMTLKSVPEKGSTFILHLPEPA